MEVIRFDGYTTDEKLAIAKGYLWPRQRDRNGLREDEVTISDDILQTIIAEYTREAGVRNLERELGTRPAQDRDQDRLRQGRGADRDRRSRPCATRSDASASSRSRRSARPSPGVATGLAVTGTGGDVLFVEATAMKRGAAAGRLVLTGQLGDVMKESARIALSYVRGHAEDLGIDESAFEDREFHVHVPAGAIPKDGPSAGVTMVTALASLLPAGRSSTPSA